jgi:hypothetical protein
MIFDLTAKKLIGYEPSKSSENLRKNFVAFIRGLISFPVEIPGTAYHECMQVLIHNRTCMRCNLSSVVNKTAATCVSSQQTTVHASHAQGQMILEEDSALLSFINSCRAKAVARVFRGGGTR